MYFNSYEKSKRGKNKLKGQRYGQTFDSRENHRATGQDSTSHLVKGQQFHLHWIEINRKTWNIDQGRLRLEMLAISPTPTQPIQWDIDA